MPELDVVGMLGPMTCGGSEVSWIMHLIVGPITWSSAFALIYSNLPRDSLVVLGMEFGLITWMLKMIIVMPLPGAGLLGLQPGIIAPVMIIMLHIIFGAVHGALSRQNVTA